MKFNFPGLNDQQVELARNQYGRNTISSLKRETFWNKLWLNFKDPIIIILMVALAITMLLMVFGYTQWYESVGIAVAVFIATFVATWSEYSNENQFQQLLEDAARIKVKVFRNNDLVEVNIDELVVGDHILLKPGDTIPTDGVLIAGRLNVNEATLTGESEPVIKDFNDDSVFRASLIDDGEAVMKATAVGENSRYGKTMLELISAEDRLSPLQEKLTILSKHISIFAYIGAIFIFVAFMLNHIFLQTDGGLSVYLAQPFGQIFAHVVTAMTLAIIIIVVAVPEGLPMMIAMVLALNMRKLLSANVLVRKLLGIETAGSLTVLFTDKTGTLTEGKQAVELFLSSDNIPYYKFDAIPAALAEQVAFAIRHNTPQMLGADKTEQAILSFLSSKESENVTTIETIPFNSTRKFSATQVEGDKNLTLIKGAPEIILANCTLDVSILEKSIHELSKRAMRLLAVAITEESIDEDNNLNKNLTLLGLFALRDPLRANSYNSVQTAKQAGIHTIMVTGDSAETAKAIAIDVGLDNNIITSKQLASMSDDEVKQKLPDINVVARAKPTDKSRLVKLAKQLNWVVGMTGDGVNDAPAVKNADVGFAMGSGTEMTKESSDIVILDDNFSSINKATLYGRTLFKSIRKFLVFQLTVNLSAILVAFLGPFFGFDLPLTMTQLLWINIIMDTLAALAFAGEAALSRYMLEPPIPKDDPLINGDMWSSILVNSSIAAVMSIIFLTYPPVKELFSRDVDVHLTAFFSFFVFMHTFNTFNARTQSLNLFEHLIENKLFLMVILIIFTVQISFIYIGGEILRTVPLEAMEWLYILMFALILIPVDLFRKQIRNVMIGNPVLKKSRIIT
jgi:calcium-translocating P-type ATPase